MLLRINLDQDSKEFCPEEITRVTKAGIMFNNAERQIDHVVRSLPGQTLCLPVTQETGFWESLVYV
jgi:hypothetical protein